MAPCFLAGNIPRRHLVVFFLAAGELGLAAATPPCACVWPPTVLVFFRLPPVSCSGVGARRLAASAAVGRSPGDRLGSG